MTDPRTTELWDAAQCAAVDRHSIEQVGMPSPLLMERAALACSHEVVALRHGAALPVVVACGPGNNGGDGLAIARQLHGWGVPVTIVRAGANGNDAVAQQLQLARACGVPIAESWPAAALVVDAVLGTGSRGAPRGAIAEALAAMTAIAGPRLAVDVPSGVDPDRGSVHAHAVRADVTVTFGRSKPGLHVTPGRAHAGRVVVADIGLLAPAGTLAHASVLRGDAIAAMLAARPQPRHKGDRGHVGIVGGGPATPGAVVLAVAAALRGGAGLVTLASDDASVRSAAIAARPELVLAPRERRPAPGAGALVVGPGLTDPSDHAALPQLYLDDDRPAVWDASALDHVPARAPAAPRILTPHPGEAARLLARFEQDAGWTAARVQADRIAAARTLAHRAGAVVVLKGEATVVADGDALAIATMGGPALATAGSGDVLAGLCGALLAAGHPARVAAGVAVMLHAACGEIAARRHRGTMALDLVDALDLAAAMLASPIAAAALPQLRLA
ncbi:MAG: NAD(P)H-hydrate dehydratase [Nannocystaceae bacterium]|nr:NAD(P)H-hydrate dehydratase [Nannocystaceae bacterium]